jgi:hypothetical protein
VALVSYRSSAQIVKGMSMESIKQAFIVSTLTFILIVAAAIGVLPNNATAQMAQWLQQEQARQMIERAQWYQWQRLEQIRQMNERAQWLQFQQQELWRRAYQR